MALMLTFGRGVLTGIGKRPSAAAQLPPVRLTDPAVRIDPARLAAYAEVCGFPPGGRETAPSGRELPLTYPHILGFPLAARIMADRAFPLPMLGLVHTSIEITAHAPLTAADRPELTAYAEELRAHRRGTEVALVTEARLDGQLVWEDRSTYLARHETGTDTDTDIQRDDPADPAPDGREPLPEVAAWRLPADLGRRHARVSRDYNPIHLYPLTARLLGFPRAIAHGMWTVARAAAQSPGHPHLAAHFRAPVLLPATVTYAAAPTGTGTAFEVRTGSRLHLQGTLDRGAPGGIPVDSPGPAGR